MNSGEKWGIFMLMGEYHHSIDEKNRMIIPARLREELGNSFIITRGLDGCLFVYSMVEWNRLVDKLKTLSFTKKDARNFSRFFLSGATTVEFDKQGRISIPSFLMEYASLSKNGVVVGALDRLEIWAEEKWNTFMSENEQEFENLAEHLFDDAV